MPAAQDLINPAAIWIIRFKDWSSHQRGLAPSADNGLLADGASDMMSVFLPECNPENGHVWTGAFTRPLS